MIKVKGRVSSKYQIVLPKAIRSKIDIKPGDNIIFSIENDEKITLMLEKNSIKPLKGSAKFPVNYLKKERLSWT